jgi:anti-sigma-K factor RskA
MSEIHALSGAYAVDALDDVERARFERHLAECADCRAEVASLREAAALLPETTATAPSADVRAAVLDRIAQVRPLPPERPATTPRRRWTARLLAAAALVLVAGVGTVAVHPWTEDRPTATERVVAAADAVRVEKAMPGGGTATLVSSERLGRAVLLTRDMPDPPAGRTYELWLQAPDGRMHPAGLVDRGGNHALLLEGDASRATAAGITVEPVGGSAEPTGEPIALFTLGSA